MTKLPKGTLKFIVPILKNIERNEARVPNGGAPTPVWLVAEYDGNADTFTTYEAHAIKATRFRPQYSATRFPHKAPPRQLRSVRAWFETTEELVLDPINEPKDTTNG